MKKPKNEPRIPSLGLALISLFSLIIGLGVSIAIFGLAPHMPMLFGVVMASSVALYCGFDWKTIQDGMINGITHALSSLIILLLVGILIGVWILGGVVPTLVYYGLQIFSPSIFLFACPIICAIASSATGTSWGTTGTVGVALMGVGAGLGLPTPLVAGAVLSGAYFGDKMSPLSDTTNMAPAMVGVDLYVHIRHMMSTTVVSFGIALIFYAIVGKAYTPQGADVSRVDSILEMLQQTFIIHPLLLIAPLLVMVLSFRKVPAIPGIAIGAIAGIIFSILVQGADFTATLNTAMSGFTAETGNADVDALLSRGGLESMAYTVSLIIVAMMFGGVMQSTGQIQVIANKILSYARSTGSLILTTALTAIGSNFLLCDQYMSLVLTGRMYAPAYKDRGLAPENLSRVTEDAGTVVDPLVPWGSGGSYQAATLGVPTILYAPFAVFCWVSPLVTILFGYMGWTIKPLAPETDTDPKDLPPASAEPALAKSVDEKQTADV
ncbi:Na+/H+ antiporter NhaC [Granulosicoccus antarcticus]|uniref:Malate-2H(+)/Na(+)-lactate antiporter n=1 Tax=Granulosicoccus antarcticus IMCC3135 TaxID=1192854 RepID=A0A2Z2NQF0_9GAMM|nr:Na+/H+ antiporter NhaC [Granulosicoccus antarcticus]ASJ73612.1 Malate-2H(+)/Na(+)-lactate antiporter [Granulosicoccus antarcticus IMCC3135]